MVFVMNQASMKLVYSTGLTPPSKTSFELRISVYSPSRGEWHFFDASTPLGRGVCIVEKKFLSAKSPGTGVRQLFTRTSEVVY